MKSQWFKGDHGIPDDVIEKRYDQLSLNLGDVVKMCDEVNIYDNTYKFIQLINIKSGKLTWKDKIMPELARIISKQLYLNMLC